MKKKALLFLPLLALFGVLAFAFKPVNTFNIAYAETSEVTPNQENVDSQEATSETFQEKVYTYEEEGEVITLTLISETVFTLTDGTDIIGGVYVRENNVVTLNYQGESFKVVVDDLKGTFDEFVDESVEKTNKLLDLYENFIAPAVSALLALLGSASFIAIVFGVIKLLAYRKDKKDRDDKVDGIAKTTGDSNDKISQASKDIKEARDSIVKVEDNVQKMHDETIESNKGVKDNTDKIPAIINVVLGLANVMVVAMSNDPDYVANGTAERANNIVDEIKDLVK